MLNRQKRVKEHSEYFSEHCHLPAAMVRDLFESIEELEEIAQYGQGYDGEGHYGPYGNHCMRMGHFDAGECWLCYAKRKKKEVVALKKKAFDIAFEKNHLRTLLTEAQARLRSAMEIAKRDGEVTNWKAWRKQLKAALEKIHEES